MNGVFVTGDLAWLRDSAAGLVDDLGSDADDLEASSTAASRSPSRPGSRSSYSMASAIARVAA